jgi:hypothetical protein
LLLTPGSFFRGKFLQDELDPYFRWLGWLWLVLKMCIQNRRETNDPLLHGPVPAPPGAVLDDPDALSPT